VLESEVMKFESTHRQTKSR